MIIPSHRVHPGGVIEPTIEGHWTDHPKSTSPLSDAIAAAGALCYALVRTMELHASWLPRIASTQSKIVLGHVLGELGERLRLTHTRFRELTDDPRLLAPRHVESNLQRLLSVDGDDRILVASVQARKMIHDLEATYARKAGADALTKILDQPSLNLMASPTESPVPAQATVNTSDMHTVRYSDRLPLPRQAETPARDPELEPRRGDEPTWAELISSERGRAQILHDVFADIELSAMEVCAASITRFRDMPIDFKVDMARQAWDEARHARACMIRVAELGEPMVGRRYSLKVWDRWKMGRDVMECLCIEQLVQEGNALDSVRVLAASFDAQGDHRSADLLRFFGRDEELHTGIGNKWVLSLSPPAAPTTYMERMQAAADRIGMTIPGHAPVAVAARRRGRFPEEFLLSIAPRSEP